MLHYPDQSRLPRLHHFASHLIRIHHPNAQLFKQPAHLRLTATDSAGKPHKQCWPKCLRHKLTLKNLVFEGEYRISLTAKSTQIGTEERISEQRRPSEAGCRRLLGRRWSCDDGYTRRRRAQ